MQQMSEKPPFSFFLQILHHCGDIIQWKRGIEWKEWGEGRKEERQAAQASFSSDGAQTVEIKSGTKTPSPNTTPSLPRVFLASPSVFWGQEGRRRCLIYSPPTSFTCSYIIIAVRNIEVWKTEGKYIFSKRDPKWDTRIVNKAISILHNFWSVSYFFISRADFCKFGRTKKKAEIWEELH